MSPQKIKSIAAAVIALAGTSAQAGTLTFNSYADGQKTQQSQQAIHMLQNDGDTLELMGPAGGYDVTYADDSGASRTFASYCINVYQYAGFTAPTAEYTVVAATASTKLSAAMAEDIGRLYSVANASGNKVDTQNEYSAMQIAVWEIVYEGQATSPHGLGTGNLVTGPSDPFTLDGVRQTLASQATLDLADSWLAQLPATASSYDVFVLDHGTSRFDAYDEDYQDQVYATPKGLTAPIPEPSTYALMLAGLAAAGLCARHKSSRRR